jgi:hypothetical protein
MSVALLAVKMLLIFAVLPFVLLLAFAHAAVIAWQLCLEVWYAFPGRR